MIASLLRTHVPLGWLLAVIASCAGAHGQQTAPAHSPTAAKATVPALFLSDIHFDPFRDPAKVAQLAKTPAAQWDALLGAPASASMEKDAAALQSACGVRGLDTAYPLWHSALEAMHVQAAGAKFVTVSGDLLAHGFDCKFKQVFPAGSAADYVGFVEQTIRYLMLGMQAAFPDTPVYMAMGNNDSGCGDYKDDRGSAFLAAAAKIIDDTFPAAERMAVRRDFANGGYYSVPLPAAVPNTKMLVLDDLFFSAKHASCADQPDQAPSQGQLQWLKTQLAEAREKKQKVWVLGHIPPGVDLYSTARKMGNLCGAAKPQMFLANEKLGQLLAEYGDVVRLALFGHTHSDELRLLMRERPPQEKEEGGAGGVPLKIVASISPINGNRPTFTLARVDPTTSSLADYSVIMASNLTGINASWSNEYTFSETFHQPAFSAATLHLLTSGFSLDTTATTPESSAYLRFFFPGDRSVLLKPLWPEYACALTHESAESYTGCVCSK